MKSKLFNLLPLFVRKIKHADKIAHLFYGTAFYLFVNLFIYRELSLFITFALAIFVEFYDKYKGGKADFLDFLFTIIIPFTLYVLRTI